MFLGWSSSYLPTYVIYWWLKNNVVANRGFTQTFKLFFLRSHIWQKKSYNVVSNQIFPNSRSRFKISQYLNLYKRRPATWLTWISFLSIKLSFVINTLKGKEVIPLSTQINLLSYFSVYVVMQFWSNYCTKRINLVTSFLATCLLWESLPKEDADPWRKFFYGMAVTWPVYLFLCIYSRALINYLINVIYRTILSS